MAVIEEPCPSGDGGTVVRVVADDMGEVIIGGLHVVGVLSQAPGIPAYLKKAARRMLEEAGVDNLIAPTIIEQSDQS